LLAVANPDSSKDAKVISEFPSVTDFRVLIDEIRKNPAN